MKKLLLAMTLTSLMTQAFAGILENRATGETLEFNLDRMSREIQILSTANNVENKSILMKSIQGRSSDIRLYGITDNTCEAIYPGESVAFCLLVPFIFVPGLAVGTIETLMLPFKASAKLIQNMKMKKDFKKLMKAINSTNQITVSNKRFRRIENLLQ